MQNDSKYKPLLFPRKKLLIAAIGIFILLPLGGLMKINHWELEFLNGSIVLSIGIILHIILFFIVLYDIIINPLRNKFLWLIGMLFFSSITMIFYLINRDKHIKRPFHPNL